MSDEIQKLIREYHKLDPKQVESLLTENFTGKGPRGFEWTRAGHIDFTSNFKGTDEIKEVMIEGNRVAVRFERTGTYGPYQFSKLAYAQFFRVENGRIAEMYEIWDELPKPNDQQA